MGIVRQKKYPPETHQWDQENENQWGTRFRWFRKGMGQLSPAHLILIGYVMTILIGAMILSLPFMVTAGNTLTFINALFTSASAVCVTGLIVVDTATFFTPVGQVVIMILFQVGGLGYMTLTTIMALVLRRRIEYRDRLAIKESLSLVAPGGVVRFTITIIKYTFLVEMMGAVVLFFAFIRTLPPGQAVFASVFHSISAFCNAGFSIFTTSLEEYAGDPLVVLVIMVLFILGGSGFIVMSEILHKRRGHSLHTRLVVQTTLSLIVIGTILVLFFEWNNPGTLGPLGVPEKILNSVFQATATRTAGFHTLPIGDHLSPTLFLMMGLMFIGASPGGTGGGVKTTVFALLLGLVRSTMQGKKTVEIYRRRISSTIIYRSVSLVVLAALFLMGVVIVILAVQPLPPVHALFEVFSAFGTVGLTTGITAELASFNKFLIIATMYVGRAGFFSLLMLRWHKEKRDVLIFPEENVSL